MAFTVEHVKSLLQYDLVTELEKAKINIVAKIKQVPYLSQSKLYEHLTFLKTVRRDLLVERDIPDDCSGKAIVLREDYHILFYLLENESPLPPKKTTMSENTIFKGKLSSL